jgi:hypothetical protein
MALSKYFVLPTVALILLSVGCTAEKAVPENKPSYADLVVTYNAEMESLDRLERKRKDLVAEYEQRSRPSPDDAVKALTDALNSATTSGGDAAAAAPADPQAILDQAVQNAEKAKQVASDLLKAAGQPASAPAEGQTPEQQAAAEVFQRQLAQLDQEIAKQRERVERARQARDAAEQQK